MKIYIDILFLTNLVMDTLILWMTAILDRRRINKKRILSGGAIGAFLYCFFIYFTFGRIFQTFAAGLISLTVSTIFVFKIRKIKTYIRLTCFSLFSAAIVGGVFTAIFSFIDVAEIISVGMQSFSFKLMLALTVLIYLFIKYVGGSIISSVSKRQGFCRIKVNLGEQWAEFTALMDTGNFLTEDTSGRKIIIAEFISVKDILCAETQLLYLKKFSAEEIKSRLSNENEIKRARLIPFSSLGTGKGSITAYTADSAEIYTDSKFVLKEPVVAVYNGKLSGGGSFCGIINPCILEE